MLEVAAPDLALAIGQAQVQVHALGRHGALQGDDLQVALQHSGLGLARALEGRLGEVAHHTQHEPGGAGLGPQLLEAGAQIAARSEMQRQGMHGGIGR